MPPSKIIQPELSYFVSGLCFQVHNKLGRFCREKQYADAFEELLIENKIKYTREKEINKIQLKSPSGNRTDFVINNTILIDFKAKKFVTKEDYYQMQRYLKSSHLKLGMIINFRNSYLKPKRILNSSVKNEP